MTVYWSLFAISIVMLFIESLIIGSDERELRTQSFYKKERFIALMTFIPLLFFLSFRDIVLDTYAYVGMFKSLPHSWSDLSDVAQISSYGATFTYMAGIFKNYVVDSHYWWFFTLALINLFCIYKTCKKYTPSMALTIYMFIAGATFTWCLNGTRQFLAVTVLFYSSVLLLKDKKLWFILIIALLSTIHTSIIFLIPLVFFLSKEKIFGKGILLVVLLTMIGTYFSDAILGSAADIMDKEYARLSDDNAGSSLMRLLFTCVTPALAWLNRKKISQIAPPAVILGINMSLIGACFMFAATFTNGILIGRMPAYFTIYNLYVLPWLLHNCFSSMRGIVRTIFVVVYALFFYVQMVIAWKELPYVSYALGINC